MRSRFSRIALASALAASLWTSAIAVVAAAPQTPQQTPTTTQKTSTPQKDSKTKPATTTTQGETKPASSGTLSSKEDPNQIGKRNINTGVWAKMSTSTEKEVALGRQLAMEIDREAKFVDDPVITEYINRVGQNIVLHSDAKVPFTIKVIDSDEVNAFALPGGFFYVNKGLILAADNEAELAGVMAHEIAHVAARHAVENQAKANAMQYGAILGSIFLGGIPGMIFQNTAGLGMLAAFMKFSRGAEAEADKLGVQYLYAAGYDPSAMATMFEKLEAKNKKKPGLLSRAFASHPQPPDRRAASIALVAKFPEREEYIVSTSEFQRVKARLMRLSNARATTAGDISGGDNGSSGRPTLKRRAPAPDDTTTTPDDNDQKPSEKQPNEAPKLKRNDGAQPASTQPNSQP
ncbi:MAG TPA: M48 family metallopeptidase [Pyrinomonadaceae bacterium]|jgi:predicted Zn-dependent protease|nr:M48 family metallopeptidase [Pyrinomonadaceae bacterium]